jgi:hypothetical protein
MSLLGQKSLVAVTKNNKINIAKSSMKKLLNSSIEDFLRALEFFNKIID